MVTVTPYGTTQFYIGTWPQAPAIVDPSSLRTRYADNKEVIKALNLLEKAIESKELGKPLDLRGANLKALSGLKIDNGEKVNLEKLIIKIGGDQLGTQYPLARACLYKADLSGANLIQADLIQTDLTYAILTQADLYKANLRGANLTGAKAVKDGKVISGEELKNYLIETFEVIINENTRF